MRHFFRKNKKLMTNLVALVLLTGLVACKDNDTKGAGSGPAVGFVLTSDFTVGNLTTLTSTTPRSTEEAILGAEGIHSDSVIKSFGGFIYILQRLGSNSIVMLDPNDPSTVLANYSTNDAGSSVQSNPHDMAFVSSSKAYVSRYGMNTVLIVNPQSGEHLGTIDLSQFADSDGTVEMSQMVLIGSKLYVSLQRLNVFSAENESYVVIIDTDTDALVDPAVEGNKIVLAGRNPFSIGYLEAVNRIYIANVGNFFTGDDFGGIEVINPDTGMSEGILINDEDFGGALGTIAILNETVAYATAFDASFNNFVVPFDLLAKTVGTALSGLGSSFIPSMAFDSSGFLYVVDRDDSNPGVQVFDTTTDQKVEGPISTGLPPNAILFVNP